ncbi:MAG: hypothetical protein BAA01_09405 [Bacillus thermozeamaize]|uniref:HTH cro/C1-type domain-containing protein n=1 Tax=Bacillus thermozeamaize TaxID=230954 RepID=A0A1Y3PE84_9BACI|nr:MAG: hypothetical protein BAA01_09405 [Bacillus thermozeamaize]
MSVIEKIEELLKEKGWTKYRLAKEARLPQSTITSLLSGRVKYPSAETLIKIANALGVSASELLGEKDLELINVYQNKKKTMEKVLSLLKLFTDDEGWFEEKFHKDIFYTFAGHLPLGPATDIFDQWYEMNFLNADEGDITEEDIEYAKHEFNEHYNYRTIKRGLESLDDYYISGKTVFDFADDLEKLARKHGMKIHDVDSKETAKYETEHEFLTKLELSDNELLKRFKLTLDGKPLTKKEAKAIIAFLRSLRQFSELNE